MLKNRGIRKGDQAAIKRDKNPRYFVMVERLESKADPKELYYFQIKRGQLITPEGQTDLHYNTDQALENLKTEFEKMFENNHELINHPEFRVFLKEGLSENNIVEKRDWQMIYNNLVSREIIKPIL